MLNRGQLRALLRERVRDPNSRWWTDAELDLELDLAAQDVATRIGANAEIAFGRATFALTTAQNTTEYPVTVDDLHTVIDIIGTGNVTENALIITETERRTKLSRHPAGLDENCRYIFFITHLANEHTILTITGDPTGGTFTVTYDGQTTGGVAYDATAAVLQTALEALSTIAVGDVAVTGDAGGPWTMELKGTLAGLDLLNVTASGASLTGGSSPTITPSRYRYVVNLLTSQSAAIGFDLIYSRTVPSIATGTANDVRGYSMIPASHQEAILQRAATVILGHDRSATAGFAGTWFQYLAGTAGQETATRTHPYQPKS